MTTTLTNSEGYIHNFTDEQLAVILLGLNSSNTYYTNGKNDLIFIKLDTTKLLLLDFSFHINRNIFQNYTIQHDDVKPYNLEFNLNGASNEFELQSAYNGSGFVGVISDLSQVFLNIYDNGTSFIAEIFWDKTNIERILNSYYTRSEVVEGFAKRDFLTDFYYDKVAIDLTHSNYFTKSDIEAMYYNQTNLDIKINALTQAFYTKLYTDTSFYNKSYIDDNYYDQSSINVKIYDIYNSFHTIEYLDDIISRKMNTNENINIINNSLTCNTLKCVGNTTLNTLTNFQQLNTNIANYISFTNPNSTNIWGVGSSNEYDFEIVKQ